MKTLIVDDQYENKAEIVAGVLRRIGASKIDLVTCARDALKKMKEDKYDLLIVDLQIPSEVGLPVDRNGGKTLLEFLELDSQFHKPTGVLCITSHQESFDECESFFKQRGWPIILGVDDPEHLYTVLSTHKAHLPATGVTYDVALITALPHTELEAVLNLPCNWKKHAEPNDFNIYYVGNFQVANGDVKSIIATSLPRMGMATASAAAAKICLKFRPTLLVMTGIAAGIKGKVKMGDILAADPCWDWGSGKLTVSNGKSKFLHAPTQMSLDPALQIQLKHISVNRTYLDQIYAAWKGAKRPAHNLSLHVGPIATGAVVLEEPETVELIKSQNRNTIGVEMEAFGVMTAAASADSPGVKAIVIKSVSDFADPAKNKEWQPYAAYTSASFALHFLQNHCFE